MDSNGLIQGLRNYVAKLRLFRRNAWMVLIFSALTGLAFGVFRLLFNFYVLSLGSEYNEEFLGVLTSASSMAALAIALPAVYIVERFSRKQVMIVTGLASALSFLGLLLFPTRFSLVLFNVISGLAQSTRQVAMMPFLMDNSTEEERTYLFSFNFGLMMTSSFMGNWIGGVLPTWLGRPFGVAPTDTLAYQLALGVMMLASVLAVGPLMAIREGRPGPDRKIDTPWVHLVRHRHLLFKLIFPQLVIGLGAGMMMPFMNVFFRNTFDKQDATIGTLFALGSLTMALAQFVAPPLADRLGKINTTVLTQGLSIPFLLTLALTSWVAPRTNVLQLWYLVAAGAYLIRLALMNLSGPVYQTFQLEQVKPEVQALTASLNSLAFQFGWAVSPYVSGWFQVEYGFVPVFLTTTGTYVLGVALTWIYFRNTEGDRVVQAEAEARLAAAR